MPVMARAARMPPSCQPDGRPVAQPDAALAARRSRSPSPRLGPFGDAEAAELYRVRMSLWRARTPPTPPPTSPPLAALWEARMWMHVEHGFPAPPPLDARDGSPDALADALPDAVAAPSSWNEPEPDMADVSDDYWV